MIGVSISITNVTIADIELPVITATLTPATSVLVVGDALEDTTNWATFLLASNYSSSDPGDVDTPTVTVNYIGDTANATETFLDGETNHFSVTVTYLSGNTRTFTTASRTVVYALAVNTVAPVVSGGTGLGALLTLSDGTWTGAAGGGFTYVFKADGVDLPPPEPFERDPWEYFIELADSGKDITGEVTYTNSGGAVTVATSNAITVDTFTAAGITGVPTLSGTIQAGQTITITPATVTGNPAPGSVFTVVPSVSAEFTVGTSFVIPVGLVGETFAVRQDATNALGAATATSTSTGVVAAAATVPAQMSAPLLVVDSSSQITATLASAPIDGGSAITGYDLRYSTDEATWTTLADIISPRAVTGLTANTLYYFQTRAVNAVGAAAWSASASDTTDAVAIPAINAFTVGTQSGTDIPVTLDLNDTAVTPYAVYFVAIPTGGTAPSAAQVVAGNNASDVAAPIFANFSASVDDTYNVTIPEATTGDYDFYATVVDDAATAWGSVASDLVVPLTFAVAGPLVVTQIGGISNVFTKTAYVDPIATFGTVDLSGYAAGDKILLVQYVSREATAATIGGQAMTKRSVDADYSGSGFIWINVFELTLAGPGSATAAVEVTVSGNSSGIQAALWHIENGVIDGVKGNAAASNSPVSGTVTPTNADNVILGIANGVPTTPAGVWSGGVASTYAASFAGQMTFARGDDVAVSAITPSWYMNANGHRGMASIAISKV